VHYLGPEKEVSCLLPRASFLPPASSPLPPATCLLRPASFPCALPSPPRYNA
jgi:hypothetical protein